MRERDGETYIDTAGAKDTEREIAARWIAMDREEIDRRVDRWVDGWRNEIER